MATPASARRSAAGSRRGYPPARRGRPGPRSAVRPLTPTNPAAPTGSSQPGSPGTGAPRITKVQPELTRNRRAADHEGAAGAHPEPARRGSRRCSRSSPGTGAPRITKVQPELTRNRRAADHEGAAGAHPEPARRGSRRCSRSSPGTGAPRITKVQPELGTVTGAVTVGEPGVLGAGQHLGNGHRSRRPATVVSGADHPAQDPGIQRACQVEVAGLGLGADEDEDPVAEPEALPPFAHRQVAFPLAADGGEPG